MQTCLSKQTLKIKVPWFYQLTLFKPCCLNNFAALFNQGTWSFHVLVGCLNFFIDCIFFTFLHCKFFKCVFKLSAREGTKPHLLDLLILSTYVCKFIFIAKRNQNHIGWICLTFPHYTFTSVFSDLLLERMHSHTDCICLAFFTVCFKMSPHIVWHLGYKVT